MLGIEAGDDGVVIGKRERGEAGEHALRSPDALLTECEEIRSTVALRVVPAEAIEGDQHEIMRLLRRGGIGAVIGVCERKSRVEIGLLRERR